MDEPNLDAIGCLDPGIQVGIGNEGRHDITLPEKCNHVLQINAVTWSSDLNTHSRANVS